MPVGEGYQPVDRVHTEVPAQVIDNAIGSHTESGKDKVKEEWMEKFKNKFVLSKELILMVEWRLNSYVRLST
ncbi:hypothetical protein PIB30_114761, partial [Stylosanthes scabra]|nr:hypothetical protein [Stylosanthes scabra]